MRKGEIRFVVVCCFAEITEPRSVAVKLFNLFFVRRGVDIHECRALKLANVRLVRLKVPGDGKAIFACASIADPCGQGHGGAQHIDVVWIARPRALPNPKLGPRRAAGFWHARNAHIRDRVGARDAVFRHTVHGCYPKYREQSRMAQKADPRVKRRGNVEIKLGEQAATCLRKQVPNIAGLSMPIQQTGGRHGFGLGFG